MSADTPQGAPAMNATGTITMTMREVDRLKVIEAVAECRLKPGQSADRLGLSVRQIERLVLRYRAAGVAGLVSCKRGRPSNHQLPEDLAHRALSLIRERYADFGPTLDSMGQVLCVDTCQQCPEQGIAAVRPPRRRAARAAVARCSATRC
ncbi:hypothetical protein WJ34_00425 [Burkholderia ubonensis]|nr:hypothetical protein WJ34_00425 [Burkholderia ubonensis]KVH48519.1 hypothetical protein WJ38_17135 [Burkholderia ubonensis]